MGKFFVTTPIYYVNDVPHIGHAYTTVAADVLARFHRWLGDDVFFLTGTDEHGVNIYQVASAQGVDPKEWVDRVAAEFKRAWAELLISNDYFIRTTDPRHEAGVRAFMEKLYASGDIYRGRYEGKYCVNCERFYSEDELTDGLCPIHLRPPVWYAEDNYFFRLSKYADRLIAAIENPEDPNHYEVEPPARRNEVLGKIRAGLLDISISRAIPWGIPLPFDPDQTVYVWVDALLNYITAIGFHDDPETFARYWPAELHLMAKDIVWFHAVIWPALLMAVGLRPPRRVFAHGFFTVNGQKMSKSLGNVIRPRDLAARFGVDATRWLLVSQFPFGQDGDISEGLMVQRYNAELANDLGNLVNRTLAMINRYCEGVVPEPGPEEGPDAELKAAAAGAGQALQTALLRLDFSGAVGAINALAARINRYIEETAPWNLARTDRRRLGTVLYNQAEALRVVAHLVSPFMPQAAETICRYIGWKLDLSRPPAEVVRWGQVPARVRVEASPKPLFPRIS